LLFELNNQKEYIKTLYEGAKCLGDVLRNNKSSVHLELGCVIPTNPIQYTQFFLKKKIFKKKNTILKKKHNFFLKKKKQKVLNKTNKEHVKMICEGLRDNTGLTSIAFG